MADLGTTTKVGFGAITGRTAASGQGSVVRYSYVATWVHGASGQVERGNVKPKRMFPDDEYIAAACKEGDPCMVRLKPGDTEPTLYVFDEDLGVEDCEGTPPPTGVPAGPPTRVAPGGGV